MTSEEILKHLRHVSSFSHLDTNGIIAEAAALIESQAREIEELKKDKNQAVDFLKQFASRSADFMEGANLPEFKIYEDQMCWATQTLHKLGVWFDPISGITKVLRNREARMSESVMQKFHELTPRGQLQEEIKTLKSQTERLAKLLDRCVHAVEQEYGIDNWRVEESKALLAEIKPATASEGLS